MSYDLHIENSPSNLKIEFLSFGDYDQTLAVRGLSKLISRFTKCFFTPRGSDLSDPNYGTTFMQYMGSSGDTRDFAMLATQAVNETVEKLREYDSLYTLEDSERLMSAEVLQIVATTEGDGVDIYVSIRSIEGSSAKFVFPLAQTA
jgi:hypothetical protein